jgi:hypothetical protein
VQPVFGIEYVISLIVNDADAVSVNPFCNSSGVSVSIDIATYIGLKRSDLIISMI